jgi:hypothetical protein
MDKNDQFLAKTFDNFLSSSEISSLMEYVTTMNEWRHIPNSFWDNRMISLYNISNPIIHNLIITILFRIQNIIIKEYATDSITYADTIDLVRWFPGMEQVSHCDDMSDHEEATVFNHRKFGCIIYLNDDYEGGQTYYSNYNYEIIPKSGTLAIHPADCNHRHGVRKIENNTRYTLASFWTLDKNRALKCISWN